MKRILGACLIFSFASAQAALIDRGGGFIYDDVLDITWTQDANLNGRQTWHIQTAWVDSLELYDTVRNVTWDDWRLPSTTMPDPSCALQFPEADGSFSGFGANCTGSELGHLFNVDGVTYESPGLFTNVQSEDYWSGTEYAYYLNPDDTLGRAWVHDFTVGGAGQHFCDKNCTGAPLGPYTWAVRDGDVAAVPLPAAIWLFGSAFAGLIGLRRRLLTPDRIRN
jgi:hypothetical protein